MLALINRGVVLGPWGGGAQFVNAFYRYAPKHGLDVARSSSGTDNPDAVLVVGLDADPRAPGVGISIEQAITYQMYFKPDCKIVLRVNDCDARKGTKGVDDLLVKVSAHVDGTVFVSRWLQDYFARKGWACNNQAVIVNGVNGKDVFKPGVTKADDGRLHVVTHHWSDNPMKGEDVHVKLDELAGEHPNWFAYTFVGRTSYAFKHARHVKPLYGPPLGEELGKHDVYVSASRFDPGPNHVLEALSCGLSTWVHADGGGAVEFAGKDHVYRTWDELRHTLDVMTFGRQCALQPNTSALALRTWEDCITDYCGFIEATCKAK